MTTKHTIFCFLVVVAVGTTTFASDFDSQLGNIRAKSQRIGQQLQQFGISDSEADADQGGRTSANEHEAVPLFQVHVATKKLQAPSGKLLFGKLINRLVVSGDSAPAIVELVDHQGIFSGLRMNGEASPAGSEGRVKMDFNQMILRSGRTIEVAALGLDKDGALGLQAEVLSGKAVAVAGAMAGSFISGLAAASQTTSMTGLGFAQTAPIGRNALLQGVAQTAADQSKRLVEETTREKPVLVIEPGASVTIYVSKEVRL